MLADKYEYFKSKLLKLRDETVQNRETLWNNIRESQESTADSAYSSPEDTDEYVEAFSREQYYVMLNREEKYLKYIDEALQALDSGEYGICRSCRRGIDISRLEAVPTTRICVQCKNKEHNNPNQKKADYV